MVLVTNYHTGLLTTTHICDFIVLQLYKKLTSPLTTPEGKSFLALQSLKNFQVLTNGSFLQWHSFFLPLKTDNLFKDFGVRLVPPWPVIAFLYLKVCSYIWIISQVPRIRTQRSFHCFITLLATSIFSVILKKYLAGCKFGITDHSFCMDPKYPQRPIG